MPTVPNQYSPEEGGTRPVRVFDLNVVSPPPGTPAMGASGDGADARTPEVAKPTGACNYVPMPDNTGPTTNGGTSLPAGHGK